MPAKTRSNPLSASPLHCSTHQEKAVHCTYVRLSVLVTAALESARCTLYIGTEEATCNSIQVR